MVCREAAVRPLRRCKGARQIGHLGGRPPRGARRRRRSRRSAVLGGRPRRDRLHGHDPRRRRRRRRRRPVQIGLIEWISGAYVVAGLVAWWHRPESRLGPLMIAGGVAAGLSALQFSSNSAAYTLGAAMDILPIAFFLHVFLAFPDGRPALGHRARAGVRRLRHGGRAPAGRDGPRRLRPEQPARRSGTMPDAAENVAQLQRHRQRLLHRGARRAGRRRRRHVGRAAAPLGRAAGRLVRARPGDDRGAAGGRARSTCPGSSELQRATLRRPRPRPGRLPASGCSTRGWPARRWASWWSSCAPQPAPADLRDALARALRDPSLRSPTGSRSSAAWADLDGRPVRAARPDPGARSR